MGLDGPDLGGRRHGCPGNTGRPQRVHQPHSPAAPSALAIGAGSGDPNTKLAISWGVPGNASRPPITDYDVRYRPVGTSGWTTVDYTPIPSNSVVLEDLEEGATYQVQVRAVNSKGGGGWSPTSSGPTGSSGNDAPYFSEGDTASRTVDDGVRSGSNVGVSVTATDADLGDTLTYSLASSGDDHESFNVDANGQITVASGKTMDYETRPSYSVTLSVHDGRDPYGNADTTIDDTIDVTITVTNLEEAGEITLSWDQPQVDSEITAELEDPNGSIT